MAVLGLFVSLLALIASGASAPRPAADEAPHKIASFPGITTPEYAWATDTELLVWGAKAGKPNFSRYNLTKGVSTDIVPWAEPREPLSGRIAFSSALPGYGAWLETPYFGQFGEVAMRVRARSFTGTKSLDYGLDLSGNWCDPVWCKTGRHDMLVVMGRDIDGPVVMVFDLMIPFPYRVEHYPQDSALIGALPGVVDSL